MNSNYVKFLAPTGLILGAIGLSFFAQAARVAAERSGQLSQAAQAAQLAQVDESGPGGLSGGTGGPGSPGGVGGGKSLTDNKKGRPGGSAAGEGGPGMGIASGMGGGFGGGGKGGFGGFGGFGGGGGFGGFDAGGGIEASNELVTWRKPAGPEPDWLIAGKKSREAEEELRTKLFDLRKVSFSLVNLREALSTLFQTSKIQFDINEEKISAKGTPSKDMSLSMESEGRIRELLRRLLQSNGLEYIVHESCLEITSSEHAASAPSLRYYDLSYVLPSNENGVELIQSIQSSILEGGQLGSLAMVGSMLIASTTERSHHQIEGLLYNLSRASSISSEAKTPGPKPQ